MNRNSELKLSSQFYCRYKKRIVKQSRSNGNKPPGTINYLRNVRHLEPFARPYVFLCGTRSPGSAWYTRCRISSAINIRSSRDQDRKPLSMQLEALLSVASSICRSRGFFFYGKLDLVWSQSPEKVADFLALAAILSTQKATSFLGLVIFFYFSKLYHATRVT